MPNFVPPDFDPPHGLDHVRFRLRPLGPEHDASDYTAWTSSMDHIRATPGFEGREWPHPMTLAENRHDLERHASDFSDRTGFTYTVLAQADDTVIGCVYIYPSKDADHDADVRSWVREADADLDPVLYGVVKRWFEESWPFRRIAYASRG
jgi:RimJ/RimL family protein N-acetyltransferase